MTKKYEIVGQENLVMNPEYWKKRYGYGTGVRPKQKPKDDPEPKKRITKKKFKDIHPELYDKELLKELKNKLVIKYGNYCMKCESQDKVIVDHIISRYYGGTNDIDNLQLLCWKCNKEKGAIGTTNYRE